MKFFVTILDGNGGETVEKVTAQNAEQASKVAVAIKAGCSWQKLSATKHASEGMYIVYKDSIYDRVVVTVRPLTSQELEVERWNANQDKWAKRKARWNAYKAEGGR